MSINSLRQVGTTTPSYARVIGLAIVGLVVAIMASVLVAAATFGMPFWPLPKDLHVLAFFLMGSGVVSVVLRGLGFRLGLGTRIPSLAVTMALV